MRTTVHVYVLEYIVETGGRINAAGLQFLSRILPLEAEGTAGLTRRHGRAALRGVSRALALQQGNMLAQIAEEIHAPDRAAQDTGEGGNSEYQDLGLEVDDDDPTDSYQMVKSPFLLAHRCACS